MITPLQIKMLGIARGQANARDDWTYRAILDHVAGVRSCKELDQVGYEDVMALLEDRGYRMAPPAAPDYWRHIVESRGSCAGSRMVYHIRKLFAEYESAVGAMPSGTPVGMSSYQLPGLVANQSKGRTRDVTRLFPKEAWNLIEALKKIIERQGTEAPRHEGTNPSSPSVPQSLSPSVPDSPLPF